MIGLAFQRYSRGTGMEAGRMRETEVGRGTGGAEVVALPWSR